MGFITVHKGFERLTSQQLGRCALSALADIYDYFVLLITRLIVIWMCLPLSIFVCYAADTSPNFSKLLLITFSSSCVFAALQKSSRR